MTSKPYWNNIKMLYKLYSRKKNDRFGCLKHKKTRLDYMLSDMESDLLDFIFIKQIDRGLH